MSIMVSRLERAGFITRKKATSDRRCAAITLTNAGSKIREQNTLLDPELVEELFGLMRRDQVEPALNGLEMLANAAQIILRHRKRRRDK